MAQGQEAAKRLCNYADVSAIKDPAARATALLERAVLFLAEFRMQETISDIDKAIELAPRSAEAWHFRARFILTFSSNVKEPGLRAEAVRSVEMARALAPDDVDVRVTEAELTHDAFKTELALAQYSEALARDPRHTYALRQRAMIHEQLDKPILAIKDVTAALEVEPRDVLLLTIRARLNAERGEDKLALPDLDNAVMWGRPDVSVFNLRSAVHVRLGNDAEALRDLSALVDGPAPNQRFALSATDLAALRMKRALVLARLKRPAEAHADILKVLEGGDQNFILRLQLLVRRNGFKEVSIDGVASPKMLDALRQCFKDAACQGTAIEVALRKA